jgi:tetrapyrrole methylase family protein/MazG family protein
MGEIVIIGLGPGDFGLLTGETLALLETRPALCLRTARHPAVAGLAERGIKFASFDYLYEEKPSFDAVYAAIAAEVVARAREADRLVYAVPGSPAVAERSVTLVREAAGAAGLKVTVMPAMSFLDLLYVRLGLDPVNGLTVTDAADIAKLPPDFGTALVVTQVYDRRVASDAKLSLMEIYPDDFPVTVARNLGLADEEIRSVPLYELDRLPAIDHLTSVYVPAPPKRTATFSLDPVVDIMAKLRSPGGCVWDIEQDHSSLRRYIVEEVYEVLEAIDLADGDKLCEELGDLLLQIVFHARIAEECGEFSMQDVVDTVTEKMIRRHPHVFGDISVRDAAEVVVNWEKIKRREHPGERPSVLDGVPGGLPSLLKAFKLQSKAAKVGFDWNSVDPVWDKISEELDELREAAAGGSKEAMEGELGDVLFSVVNLARFFDIDPETALNATNSKFVRRFSHVEDAVKKRGLKWKDLTIRELDLLWDEAKMPKIKEK